MLIDNKTLGEGLFCSSDHCLTVQPLPTPVNQDTVYAFYNDTDSMTPRGMSEDLLREPGMPVLLLDLFAVQKVVEKLDGKEVLEGDLTDAYGNAILFLTSGDVVEIQTSPTQSVKATRQEVDDLLVGIGIRQKPVRELLELGAYN